MKAVVALALVALLHGCRTTDEGQVSAVKDDPAPGGEPEPGPGATAQGTITPMFHPFDATLEKVGELLRGPSERVDIAMYNMDVSNSSPVVQALKDPAVAARIQSGALKLRMVFEGYGTPQENKQRSEEIEALGIDVRWLASGRMVHHKFAVFDANSDHPALVTGSANWSVSSQKAYNENWVLFEGMQGVATAYQREFEKLWAASDEFGVAKGHPGNTPAADQSDESPGVEAHFNSQQFVFDGTNVSLPTANKKKSLLTRQVVRALDEAQSHAKIATTRINLRPIYDAVLRAAARGVKVDILINQDQYNYLPKRKQMKLRTCAPAQGLKQCCDAQQQYDAFEEACSTSQIFGHFLDLDTFPGHENVEVRLKFFNLVPSAYLTHQMHAKYTIIDDRRVWAGSFNYSHSAEYSHIENMVMLDGDVHPNAVKAFVDNFETIYNQGRDEFLAPETGFVARFEKAHAEKTKTNCAFKPVALSYKAIDEVLDTRERHHKWPNLKAACE